MICVLDISRSRQYYPFIPLITTSHTMTLIFWSRKPLYFTRCYRKFTWLFVAAFLFFLWDHLPEPPKTANNARMDRPPPQGDLATKPRFLYHSDFRVHPDSEYEAAIEDSLKRIEAKVRIENQGNAEAKEVIWQILLGKERESTDRGADSIAFEQMNPEWEYNERLPNLISRVETFPVCQVILTHL